MDDFPSLCQGAMCASSECCDPCPFEGFWESTNVFGGDALEVFPDGDGWKVRIVAMPSVQFEFIPGDFCSCRLGLDSLTYATGQMDDKQSVIMWDMILNNDLWIQSAPQDRRLDNKRNYEIRDGGIVVLGEERRLQQQNVRVDYEISAASAADALAITGQMRELTLDEIKDAFNDALSDTPYAIGFVYQVSDPETEQVVIQSNNTLTSGVPVPSSQLGALVPVLVMIAVMF